MAAAVENATLFEHSDTHEPCSQLRRSGNYTSVGNASPPSRRRSRNIGSRVNVSIEEGSGGFACAVLIANAAFGISLLNFPYIFNQVGGIWIALSLQAILLLFVAVALLVLANCSDHGSSSTLQKVLYVVAGKAGQHAASCCVILYCFGVCVIFMTLIGDQTDTALFSTYGRSYCDYWYMRREFTISAISFCFILPLCFSARIDFLRYTSFIGILVVVYVVGVVMYEYFQITKDYIYPDLKQGPDSWIDVLLAAPVICFSCQCHVSAVPIYSCLKPRRLSTFSWVTSLAILFGCIAYASVGIFGYLSLGVNVPYNILSVYDATKPYISVLLIAWALKMCFTYPILAFCGREAVFDFLRDVCCFAANSERLARWGRIIISLAWFGLTLTLSALVPQASDVIRPLTSLASIFIFVFPGVCLLLTALRRDPSLCRKRHLFQCIVACIWLAVGAFLFGVSFMQSIQFRVQRGQIIDVCNEQ